MDADDALEIGSAGEQLQDGRAAVTKTDGGDFLGVDRGGSAGEIKGGIHPAQ